MTAFSPAAAAVAAAAVAAAVVAGGGENDWDVFIAVFLLICWTLVEVVLVQGLLYVYYLFISNKILFAFCNLRSQNLA